MQFLIFLTQLCDGMCFLSVENLLGITLFVVGHWIHETVDECNFHDWDEELTDAPLKMMIQETE